MSKTALEKVVPPLFEVKIKGTTYTMQRLTLKGIFRLGSIISKLSIVLNLPEVLSSLDKAGGEEEDKEKVYDFVSQIVASLPLCENEVYGLIQSLLVSQDGKHPTLEDVSEMSCDDVIRFLQCFAETEDLIGVLRNFFGAATQAVAGPTRG